MSPSRQERLRIFIGCEGESERSYVACLHTIADTGSRKVHLDGQILPGGDPLSRLERAVQMLPKLIERRGEYVRKFALLDFDQVSNNAMRLKQVMALAEQAGITVIWQKPAHEGLLLKHLEGFDGRNFATTQEAMEMIGRAWSGYRKGQPRGQYCRRIGLLEIRLASTHDAALRDLLTVVGLLPATA